MILIGCRISKHFLENYEGTIFCFLSFRLNEGNQIMKHRYWQCYAAKYP